VSSTAIVDVETPALSRVVPADIAQIFGDPPVLITENREAYDQLMSELALEWKPRNFTEWMFVRDIADITWEIFRHRRAIANVFAISFKKGLARVFDNLLPNGVLLVLNRSDEIEAMANDWFDGPNKQTKVKSELAKYGLSPEAIVAECYSINRETLDKLHRLQELAERRRTAITRQFSEYRAISPLRETPVINAEEAALVPHST
jgi:hypothetical protein